MVAIGLTGGIASGKSTVAGMLREEGAHLLDADLIAREIVRPGSLAWREIVDWLGENILTPDRSIDRRRLGELVFGDPGARERLNRITHPLIVQELMLGTEKFKKDNPGSVLVLVVPLLIELGLQSLVDLVLLAYVTPEIQLARLKQRDGLSTCQAMNRLQAQMPLTEKRVFAHYIIDNSGAVECTARQVKEFWNKVVKDHQRGLEKKEI